MYSTSIYLAPAVYRTYAGCWGHVVTQVEVTTYRERQTVSSNWNKIMAGGGDKGSEGRKRGQGGEGRSRKASPRSWAFEQMPERGEVWGDALALRSAHSSPAFYKLSVH